jgi:hypothetical protein
MTMMTQRCSQRLIAEVKQRWSAIGWVTENVLSLLAPLLYCLAPQSSFDKQQHEIKTHF